MADGDEEYACCWNSAVSDVPVSGHGDYKQDEEDNIFAYNVTTCTLPQYVSSIEEQIEAGCRSGVYRRRRLHG